MLKDFYKRLGLIKTFEEAKESFMIRVNVTILDHFSESWVFWRPAYLKWLSVEIGEDWKEEVYKLNNQEYIKDELNLRAICSRKFNRYLLILESIYRYIPLIDDYGEKGKKEELAYLNDRINEFLEKSEIDLGVFWKDGKFYLSGSKLFDKKLVIDVLDWLNDFPAEKKDFENALKARLEKRDNDAIGECYNCVEGIAKKILKNKSGLESNKEALVVKLGFSQEWKSFIIKFMHYANDFKRHASEVRHDVNPDEVEAFIYLTGLIIRMCIKRNNK